MLATAHSKEEVLEVLRQDIYTREGVWDLERVQVIPVRQPSFLVGGTVWEGEGGSLGRGGKEGEGGKEKANVLIFSSKAP